MWQISKNYNGNLAVDYIRLKQFLSVLEQICNFVHYFVGVRNLVAHTEGKTWAEGV